MSILYFFESIRNPVLDFLFSAITFLGEETFFIVIALLFFWCVDKYEGYYMLTVGFIGTVMNQFLKMMFRIPRPWVKDPNFTIVESARSAASGYSFPSGHTQSGSGVCASVFCFNKNKIIRITVTVLFFLIPISRMYLGVHTPLDVCVSMVTSVVIAVLLYPLIIKCRSSPKTMYYLLLFMTLICTAFAVFISLYKFPDEVYNSENISNLLSARKNAFTLLGCIIGLDIVYPIDRKYLNFSTKAVWWKQIIKFVGGLLLVLAVKELLRTPLNTLINNTYISRCIRYFLVVITAGIVWPWIFSGFCKEKGK